MVSPDAAVPSTVTANVLLVSGPLEVGVRAALSWVQLVCEPEMLKEAEARVAPEELCSEMFKEPEKELVLGER